MSAVVKSIAIPSGTLRCAVFGHGATPLVMIPGLGIKSVIGAADDVASAYHAFQDSHTVYLIERRDSLPAGVTIEEITDDTAAAMRALGIQNADVFATSFGGRVAMLLAIQYPDLVGKLVLGSTAACTNPLSEKVISGWIDLATARRREDLCRDFIEKVYSAPVAEKFGDFLVSRMADCSDADLEQMIHTAASSKGFDIRDRLGEIKCPVLVLGAENDSVLTGEASREIADLIGCECFLYGAPYNHAVYDEAPDYKERLLTFYRR